jgi:alkaline phosphatase D
MKSEDVLKKLSRRKFLRNSAIAATGVALLPSLITGCHKDDQDPSQGQGFKEGVGSFDPSQNKVIFWTRYTPAAQEQLAPVVILDVAKDKGFNNVVVSKVVQVDSNSDNTVFVDVSGLTSNTRYYYRFRNEKTKSVSVTGETKTLPAAGESTAVKMAVVSCADYEAGLFNVYGAVAESDADFVVHLGDYIYEYEPGRYGTNPLLNRVHQPAHETITLDDYRQRYRQYRSDEQLQKAHQLKPFICVWDDHEVANDAYKDGAENHQPNEGDWNTRKMSAIQAWHEYLPCRVSDKAKIYRNFEIDNFVNLIMLDTRLIGRDKQLNYADYLTSSGLNVPQFLAAWQNPQRSMLGQEQKSWLISKINGSTKKWQVLGNQVLMAKLFIPAELLLPFAQVAAGNTDPALLAQFRKLLTELVTIKARLLQGDPTLTAAEKARVQTVLPQNLDAWDGYPAEREMIYAAVPGKKLISVAGDSHNAWYSVLSTNKGTKAGAEFGGPSITAPGFEAIFGNDPASLASFEQAATLLIDDLRYLEASKKGYVMAIFTANEAKAEYRFVNTITSKTTATVTEKTVTES